MSHTQVQRVDEAFSTPYSGAGFERSLSLSSSAQMLALVDGGQIIYKVNHFCSALVSSAVFLFLLFCFASARPSGWCTNYLQGKIRLCLPCTESAVFLSLPFCMCSPLLKKKNVSLFFFVLMSLSSSLHVLAFGACFCVCFVFFCSPLPSSSQVFNVVPLFCFSPLLLRRCSPRLPLGPGQGREGGEGGG